MELSNNTLITTVRTPEAETEALARIQHNKHFSISNGVLKRHNPLYHHHPVMVVYKECLKNHAATMGGHAVDGCGEFMPSPSVTDPTSLKCAACGCHRNFHRREPEDPFPPPNTAAALEYQPHHRHHPPPPPPPNRRSEDHSCPNSPSPPPISSAYYPSAPHILLALSSGFSGRPVENNLPISISANPNSSSPVLNPNGRKRFRTKFTQNQKERMLQFAERVGWRMQKQDEELINKLCLEIGVEKGVLKVWMHNNKNNFCRKNQTVANNNGNANSIDFGISSRNDNSKDESRSQCVNHPLHSNISVSAHVVGFSFSS